MNAQELKTLLKDVESFGEEDFAEADGRRTMPMPMDLITADQIAPIPVVPKKEAPNPWIVVAAIPEAASRSRKKKLPGRAKEKNEKLRCAARRMKVLHAASTAILGVAVAAFVGCSVFLAHYAADSVVQRKKNDAIAAEYQAATRQDADEPMRLGTGMLQKFDALYQQNNDLVGWLSMPAIGVERPVMKGSDNDYYLTHDVQRALSRYGALFADSGNILTQSQSSANLSVYGHNTKNGSMFGSLGKYRDLAFYKQNPTFSFDTLYEEKKWVIFAVIVTNAYPAQDDGNFFEWREVNLSDPNRMDTFVTELRARSLIDSPVEVGAGDKLLNLTTCAYDFKDARLVVFARELREGEEADVSDAVFNESAKRPAAWSG